MATYPQIQEWIQKKYGFSVETCWIADVKEKCRLPMRTAHNRKGKKRVKPCPKNKIRYIKKAFRHFKMI